MNEAKRCRDMCIASKDVAKDGFTYLGNVAIAEIVRTGRSKNNHESLQTVWAKIGGKKMSTAAEANKYGEMLAGKAPWVPPEDSVETEPKVRRTLTRRKMSDKEANTYPNDKPYMGRKLQ